MKWAALVPANERPAILNQTHSDWPGFLKAVPRAWSAWLGDPPRTLAGTGSALKPIPDPGIWVLATPFYLALQTSSGWLFRLGMRWDDVDHYYALGFTIKKESAGKDSHANPA
jgi:hypothetical protein